MVSRLIILASILLVALFLAVIFWPQEHPSETHAWLQSLRTEPTTTFQKPQPGDQIRIELSTGAVREGIIRELTEYDVTIETPSGEVTYPRQHIAPGSRQLLFRSDYEGTPVADRPATVIDEDLIRLMQTGDPGASLGLGPRVQYVIAGTNAIILYGFPE